MVLGLRHQGAMKVGNCESILKQARGLCYKHTHRRNPRVLLHALDGRVSD